MFFGRAVHGQMVFLTVVCRTVDGVTMEEFPFRPCFVLAKLEISVVAGFFVFKLYKYDAISFIGVGFSRNACYYKLNYCQFQPFIAFSSKSVTSLFEICDTYLLHRD